MLLRQTDFLLSSRLSPCGTVRLRSYWVDVNIRPVWICGPLVPSSLRCALASLSSLVTLRLTKSSKSSGGCPDAVVLLYKF